MADSVAYKNTNTSLEGTFIPGYSSVALGLSYSGLDNDTFPDFNSGYGSTIWKNGITVGGTANGAPTTVYYVIYSDEYSQDIQPNPGLDILPLAWAVLGPDQNDIRDKINDLPAMSEIPKHSTYTNAINWLIGQNKYLITNGNYPSIGYRYNQTPLVFTYDPTFIASYPLVGTNVYDLTGRSFYGLLKGGCYWDTIDKNSFVVVPNTGSYLSISNTMLPYLDGSSGFTISIWFNITSLPSNVDAGTLLYLNDTNSATGNNPQPSAGTWLRIFIDSIGKINIEGDPKLSGNCPPPEALCSAPSPGTWSSLIISVSESDIIQVVLDGADLGTINYNFDAGPFSVISPRASSIGAQQSGNFPLTAYQNGTGFDGKIGAVHIYFGELSVGEMQDLYTKTSYLYP
jgi:hypothetical protein